MFSFFNNCLEKVFLRKFIQNPISLVLKIIFFFIALQAIFNILIDAILDIGFPYTTFLFLPSDRFADYFEVILSYPMVNKIKSFHSAIALHYLHNNNYHGVDGLVTGTVITHFHLTPLSTLFSLMNLHWMKHVSPQECFVFLLIASLCMMYLLVKKISSTKKDQCFWMLSMLLCYPTLFLVTRGNLFAGIAFLTLLGALLFFREGKIFWALLLLAIGVNIRPNAMIFIFAMLIGNLRFSVLLKGLLYFCILSSAIFFISLRCSHILYHSYTLTHFLKGLYIYHFWYAIHSMGIAYDSSIFGMLKLFPDNFILWGPLKSLPFDFSNSLEVIGMIIAGLCFLGALWLKIKNKIFNSTYIFMLCAVYVLGSSIIEVYHLGIFFAPLIYLYLESKEWRLNQLSTFKRLEILIVFFASICMLIPKNYYFFNPENNWSIEMILNPAFLFFAVVALFFCSARVDS